jgi:hypothetical protein
MNKLTAIAAIDYQHDPAKSFWDRSINLDERSENALSIEEE